MTSGYGLSAISPIGTYGLGSTGTYGTMFDNYMPSTLGMNYMMNGMSGMNGLYGANNMYGMYGMGGMGGMGMMMQYPLYMQQMQNEIEKNNLNHMSFMHNGMLKHEVQAHEESLEAGVKRAFSDGDIQEGISKLYTKVREGDQDGICQEYDKLKSYIFAEYKDCFKEKGSRANHTELANRLIRQIYGNMITAQGLETTGDLEADIKKYGDGAFTNGFMSGFRKGHHEKNVDQTLNHIFGTRIDHYEEKKTREAAGNVLGRGASVAEKAVIGGITGAGLYMLGGGTVSLLKKTFGGKLIKPSGRLAAIAAVAGAALGAIYDIGRQATGSSAA